MTPDLPVLCCRLRDLKCFLAIAEHKIFSMSLFRSQRILSLMSHLLFFLTSTFRQILRVSSLIQLQVTIPFLIKEAN